MRSNYPFVLKQIQREARQKQLALLNRPPSPAHQLVRGLGCSRTSLGQVLDHKRASLSAFQPAPQARRPASTSTSSKACSRPAPTPAVCPAVRRPPPGPPRASLRTQLQLQLLPARSLARLPHRRLPGACLALPSQSQTQ